MAASSPKILLVEDDVDLGNVLGRFMELSGFAVERALTGLEGLAAFQKGGHDLCVLDVGIPGLDGFALAAKIREIRPDAPVLFLTARAMKADRMRGLEWGADDYVTKPFEPDELILRLRNILRRSGRTAVPLIRLGSFELEPERRVLRRGDIERVLTPREAELLRLLSEHRNRLLKRTAILNAIWGKDDYFLGRSLDVFISRLRKLLEDDESLAIESIRGEGFILKVRNS